MPKEIKAGDSVQLKSGGPVMTADAIGEQGGIFVARCVWSTGKNNYENYYAVR